MADHADQYIDGHWTPSTGADLIDVVDSTDARVIARTVSGSADDAARAVAAARAAFGSWSSTPVAERAALMKDIAEGITKHSRTFTEFFVRQVGMTVVLAEQMVEIAASTFLDAATQATSFAFEEEVGTSLVVRDPIGVVGCITPWNYPLNQIASKVAYAMAAGATVVLKPSEMAPLDALLLTELIDGSLLPPGVFNLVLGTGPIVGELLASHPDVDMLTLTGSTRAGRRVSEIAAATIKRVHLELGAKSASIVLDDLDEPDFAAAVRATVASCFANNGQTCSAHTRLLVPRHRMYEAAEVAKDEVLTVFQPGDPFDRHVRLGPLASQVQVERVVGYVGGALAEGARLVVGGTDRPSSLGDGYFVTPTVFADVTPDMTIAQEEVFGPVLAIIGVSDEDDAVDVANRTIYGLHGGVWSTSAETALRVARRLRTGQVTVNGGQHSHLAPWGGFKQSGNGREFGRYGFEEFLELKAMHR